MVGNRSARPGAYATSARSSSSIVPARGLWVDANFKENQLAHMRPGLPATVEADVLPGEVFRGHVASLAPATGAQFSVLPPENATGNFTKIVQRVPVRIVLDGDASTLGRLRPGLSVTVAVDERPLRSTRHERDADRPALAPLPAAAPGELPTATSSWPSRTMCVGFFIALLDIQIVSASLHDIGGGLSAGAGRDRLGADHLPDRRDHRDPAVGLAVARVVDALAVHRLGGRLHR